MLGYYKTKMILLMSLTAALTVICLTSCGEDKDELTPGPTVYDTHVACGYNGQVTQESVYHEKVAVTWQTPYWYLIYPNNTFTVLQANGLCEVIP